MHPPEGEYDPYTRWRRHDGGLCCGRKDCMLVDFCPVQKTVGFWDGAACRPIPDNAWVPPPEEVVRYAEERGAQGVVCARRGTHPGEPPWVVYCAAMTWAG